MQITKHVEGDKGVVSLGGRFDFNRHREFRAACDALLEDPQVRLVRVDLGRVDYMDSSALGMLLMLRDKVVAGNKQIELANVQGSVRQVLEIANFGKLFTLV